MQKPGPRSAAASLASLGEAARSAFLDGLSENALAALPWLWEVWAHPQHQAEPGGDWHTWVILGGRGAGKTRAGAEWVRAQVEGTLPQDAGCCQRVALVGETIDQVRAVMVEGESGLLAVSPPDRRPELRISQNRLVWQNGAEAALVSAANPEALRGPQFDCAWSDETGCAAIDMGSNQPNLFSDGKSSESFLPFASLGVRDDEIQRRFLQAKIGYWTKPGNVPVSSLTGEPMLPGDRIFVWTWDARPWPDFPVRTSVWSDGPAHRRGHWISGRVSASGLADVVAEICARSGLAEVDVADLHGSVAGYLVDTNASVREALQPLMLAYGFDAFESGGKVTFRMRVGSGARILDEPKLVAPRSPERSALERIRGSEGLGQDAVRLHYVQAESDYRISASEARLPGGSTSRVAETSLPLALAASKAQQVADRWLAETWRSRDRCAFSIPLQELGLEPGDSVEFPRFGSVERYRIERIVDSVVREIDAVRIEEPLHLPNVTPDRNLETGVAVPLGPIAAIFLDIPLASGGETDHLPRIAVTADPWTDRVAVFRSPVDDAYNLAGTIAKTAVVGRTLDALPAGAPDRWHRVSIRVATQTGALEAADGLRVLNGANMAAVEFDLGAWEIVQFQDAALTAPGEYTLSNFLRGQRGTGALIIGAIPSGARFVLLDDAVVPLPMTRDERGMPRHYRVGPARNALSHPSYLHSVQTFAGIGLRPFAPAHLKARRQGADISVRWIRTARFGGDSWAGLDVPLTEDREAYRVRIVSGGQLLRETEVAAPIFLYTAAMQAADGGGPDREFRIAQLSTEFGYGPERVFIADV